MVTGSALPQDLRKQDCASPSSFTWPITRPVDPFHRIRSAEDRRPDRQNSQFARMLEWAYGYRAGESARRRAPSAGALYPCELITIEPGTAGWRCFLYDFQRRQRIWLPAVDAGAAAQVTGLAQGQAAVIAAAALWRTVQRYGARGYRYCALDAGHVMGNLSRVAGAATSHPSWRAPAGPQLSGLLALPGSVAALAVGVFDLPGPDLPAPPGAVRVRPGPAGQPGHPGKTGLPEEPPLVSPQLLRALRFHERVQECAAAPLAAPPAATAAADLFGALEARRSAKDFLAVAPDEFPPRRVAAVAEYLGDGTPEAGQFLPLAARHGREPPAGTLTQAELCQLCGQQDLVSRAGAAFLFTCQAPGQPGGSLDHGGFLRACLYAGMVSAELYRLAVSLRLASTMIGGFFDSAMLPMCEPGRYPLALQLFGHPETAAQRKVDAAVMVTAGA